MKELTTWATFKSCRKKWTMPKAKLHVPRFLDMLLNSNGMVLNVVFFSNVSTYYASLRKYPDFLESYMNSLFSIMGCPSLNKIRSGHHTPLAGVGVEWRWTSLTISMELIYDHQRKGFCKNWKYSSSSFGGLVVLRQKNPPNMGRMGCVCWLLPLKLPEE